MNSFAQAPRTIQDLIERIINESACARHEVMHGTPCWTLDRLPGSCNSRGRRWGFQGNINEYSMAGLRHSPRAVQPAFLPLVMAREWCDKHGAPQGIPCFHIQKHDGSGYLPGVCNDRAKRAGMHAKISYGALVSRKS